MTIRPIQDGEAERLREIARMAKGHWGYDAGQVASWAAALDFSPEELRVKEVFVVEERGRIVAWGSLIPQGDVAWLEDMWVSPEWMGKGFGAQLFRHAAERGRALGAARMEWDAEPNAVGFYERMGGRYERDGEPSEWGRVLPVMSVPLA